MGSQQTMTFSHSSFLSSNGVLQRRQFGASFQFLALQMIRSNVDVIGDISYILRVGKLGNVFVTSTRLFLGVRIFVVAPLLLLAKRDPPQQHNNNNNNNNNNKNDVKRSPKAPCSRYTSIYRYMWYMVYSILRIVLY